MSLQDRPKQNRLLLGRRMTMVVAGIAIFLAVSYLVMGLRLTRKQIEQDQLQGAEFTAASLASSLIEAMFTDNLHDIPPMLERTMVANSNALYAFVCDHNGAPVAHTFKKGVPGDLQALAESHARSGGDRGVWNLDTDKGEVLHLAYPLEGRPGGYLHLGFSWGPADARLRNIARQLIGSMLIGLMVAALAGLIIYRRMAPPIMELTTAAADFGAGDLSRRVRTLMEPDDEVSVLSRAFNRMAEQIQEQITELERSRSELADEKTRIQAILDGMVLGVIFYEPSGRIGYWNDVARNHWGWDRETEPASRRDLHPDHPQINEALESLDKGNGGCRHLQVRRGEKLLDIYISSIMSERGSLLGAVEISSDVTEQAHAARALAHAEKMNVVGQLAAGVAHEINSPLDGAIEASRIIEAGDCPPDQSRAFAKAQRAALERIAAIVKRLLTFSRREDADIESVVVSEAIREAVELVSHRITKSGVKVETPAPDRMRCSVSGQSLEVSQVIVNLLSNALDESREGGTIRIDSWCSDRWVVISVTDQGGGIPEKSMDWIFTPFFTTKSVGKGTGLGLAVSKNIVEKYGGRIEFTNMDPPWGAKFIVYLPRMEKDRGQCVQDRDQCADGAMPMASASGD